MSAETGRMLRVRPETLARMQQCMRRLELAAADGHIKAWWKGDTITSDEFVARLVAQHAAHSQRAKIAKKRRAWRKKMEAMEDLLIPTQGFYVTPDGTMARHPYADTRQEGTSGD